MSKPYVKRYDAQGVLLNPITKHEPYMSTEPNRAAGRMQQPRFRDNHKGISLVIVGTTKFERRRVQKFDKMGRCVCNRGLYISK